MKTKLFFLAAALLLIGSFSLQAHSENPATVVFADNTSPDQARVYPNPFKTEFNVYGQSPIRGIRVISMEGHEMSIQTRYNINGVMVQMTSGEAGDYILEIQYKSGNTEVQMISKA